jgi:hypothetical protein
MSYFIVSFSDPGVLLILDEKKFDENMIKNLEEVGHKFLNNRK